MTELFAAIFSVFLIPQTLAEEVVWPLFDQACYAAGKEPATTTENRRLDPGADYCK